MTRGRVAARLTVMLALTGVAPILLVGAIAVEVMRRHAEESSTAALRAVAGQAAGRIDDFLRAQEEVLRIGAAAAAGGPDAGARLEAAARESPGLEDVTRVGPGAPPERLAARFTTEELARAARGETIRSGPYRAEGGAPALDLCLPSPREPGHAICASLDLRELGRIVQQIRVEGAGYALAFDGAGRLVASGAAPLAAGAAPPESALAVRVAAGAPAPARWVGADGVEMLGGWSLLPRVGWTVAVARPAAEALQGARMAQWVLAAVAIGALALSVALGIAQSHRVLAELEVEERWRTAGRIAAGLSHDLGHRVTILQHVATLAETGDPRVLPRIRDALRAEVEKLRKFVVDFGDLSRDVRDGDLVPVDLQAFVQGVARTAAPHAERQGIRLSATPGDGAAWARADRYALERAVLNLVWNACDASPKGAEVRLRAWLDGDRARLAVEDRGAGIAPERLPHIFDAFASTKRAGGHLGMGLANVKRIVTGLGGTVEVASAPGGGSTFTVSLPAVEPPEPLAQD